MICIFTSCDYLSFRKNNKQEKLDTIVNVKEVDVFPSFKVCDSIIDKAEKTNCFRSVIHQEIAQNLKSQNIKVKRSVDETITVIITIHSDRTIALKSISASDSLYQEIPDLKQMIEKSIAELPEVFPAIKIGIPVTSEYILPIRVKLEN
jgi:hypothetical protein